MALTSFEPRKILSSSNIPDANRLILAGSDEELSDGGKRATVHCALVALQRGDHLFRFNIPQENLSVFTRRSDDVAVRVEIHCGDRLSAALQDFESLESFTVNVCEDTDLSSDAEKFGVQTNAVVAVVFVFVEESERTDVAVDSGVNGDGENSPALEVVLLDDGFFANGPQNDIAVSATSDENVIAMIIFIIIVVVLRSRNRKKFTTEDGVSVFLVGRVECELQFTVVIVIVNTR